MNASGVVKFLNDCGSIITPPYRSVECASVVSIMDFDLSDVSVDGCPIVSVVDGSSTAAWGIKLDITRFGLYTACFAVRASRVVNEPAVVDDVPTRETIDEADTPRRKISGACEACGAPMERDTRLKTQTGVRDRKRDASVAVVTQAIAHSRGIAVWRRVGAAPEQTFRERRARESE